MVGKADIALYLQIAYLSLCAKYCTKSFININNWVMRCSGIWSNVILSASVRGLGDEINI